MFADAKLPKTFYAEALMTVAYVIYQSPSVPLDGDIPQRVWSGKDVSYRHLRVFGCLAYVHVAKDQRGKLDPKSWPCIFLGYNDDEFGYRLWNLAEKKVIRRWDIVFMEEKTIIDWEKEKSDTSSRPVGNQTPTEEQGESAKFGPGVGSVGGQLGVGQIDNRQSQEPTEEQGEPVERRQSAERGQPMKGMAGWRTGQTGMIDGPTGKGHQTDRRPCIC